MRVNPDCVLVLPDNENKELMGKSESMDLDKKMDYCTGIIKEIGQNLKNDPNFVYKIGDWIHYRPSGGWIVHLGRSPGEKISKQHQLYKIMLAEQILIAE